MLESKFTNPSYLIPSFLRNLSNQSFFVIYVSFTVGVYFLVLHCKSPLGFSQYQIDFLFDKLISLSLLGIEFRDSRFYIPFDL